MAKDEKQNVTYDEITAHQGRDYGSFLTPHICLTRCLS